jgi:hypothetical protein
MTGIARELLRLAQEKREFADRLLRDAGELEVAAEQVGGVRGREMKAETTTAETNRA